MCYSKHRETACLTVDRVDFRSCKLLSGLHLPSVLQDAIDVVKSNYVNAEEIDSTYYRLLNILRVCSDSVVPVCRKNKYWWDEEMNEIKHKSMDSCRAVVGGPAIA